MGALLRVLSGMRTHGWLTRYPANLPIALLLVLAVAGSAAPSIRSHADQAGAVQAAATPGSVTVITPQRYPADLRQLPPPIRIAATGAGHSTITQVAVANILLAAYRKAAAGAPASCHLPVSLLAAIGQVESGSLAGRTIDAHHNAAILGPVLDGTNGFRAIADTDNGRWDGNKVWDRAVGPLQFIPSTWRTFGVDGNGDGVADPQNIEDATATAAAYLCYGGRNLSDPAQLRSAVLAYNDSSAYQQLVLTYQKRFANFGLDSRATVIGLSLGAVGAPVAGQALPGVYTSPSGAPTVGPKHRTGNARHHRSTGGSTSRPTVAGSPTRGPSGSGGDGSGNHPSTDPTKKPTTQPSRDPGRSEGPSPSASGTPSSDPTTCPPTPSATGDPTATPSPRAGDTTGAGTDTTATCPPCGEPTATASATADPSGQPSGDPSADPSAPATCEPPVTDPSSSASP